jgi:hypothetical protein
MNAALRDHLWLSFDVSQSFTGRRIIAYFWDESLPT